MTKPFPLRRPAILLALCLGLGHSLPARSADTLAETVSCPPVLSFQAMPEAPFGWLPNPARDVAAFREGRLINAGDRAKMAATPPPDGVPAERMVRRARSVTRLWNLNGTRAPQMILLCLYNGTSATIALELPRGVRRCEFTTDSDDRGNRRDRPERPPQFVCR